MLLMNDLCFDRIFLPTVKPTLMPIDCIAALTQLRSMFRRTISVPWPSVALEPMPSISGNVTDGSPALYANPICACGLCPGCPAVYPVIPYSTPVKKVKGFVPAKFCVNTAVLRYISAALTRLKPRFCVRRFGLDLRRAMFKRG